MLLVVVALAGLRGPCLRLPRRRAGRQRALGGVPAGPESDPAQSGTDGRSRGKSVGRCAGAQDESDCCGPDGDSRSGDHPDAWSPPASPCLAWCLPARMACAHAASRRLSGLWEPSRCTRQPTMRRRDFPDPFESAGRGQAIRKEPRSRRSRRARPRRRSLPIPKNPWEARQTGGSRQAAENSKPPRSGSRPKVRIAWSPQVAKPAPLAKPGPPARVKPVPKPQRAGAREAPAIVPSSGPSPSNPKALPTRRPGER